MKLFLRISVAVMIVMVYTNHAFALNNEDIIIQVVVPEGYEYAVADELDGVDARYRESSSDIYGEYSCAGYASRYFIEIYGINLHNLIDAGPPAPADKLIQVHEPQKGDLIFYPSPPNANNHSAIVKRVEQDRIIVIEQNYKWRDASGNTYTYIDRSIPYPPGDYQIWRAVNAPVHEDDDKPDIVSDREPLYVTFSIDSDEITIDDALMAIDAPPFIENERTMIPLKYLAFALGINNESMQWYPSGYVTVDNSGINITAVIGSSTLYVNGDAVEMDAPAILRNERTYLPVKYLADALGVEYFWNDTDRSVTFLVYGDI